MQMDKIEIFKSCIADIERIEQITEGARCENVPLAKQLLTQMKERWQALIREHKKSPDIANVVFEAATRLPNASHRPETWGSYLYDAKGDFTFRLYHPHLP
jgi:hypothetical protein